MRFKSVNNMVNKIEQEIVRKERLARDAKEKGMHTTYSNYLMDISVLKTKLQKFGTSPLKKVV
jgi:hypothetical protein